MKELINVLLNPWINRASIDIFERLTKLLWVVVLFLKLHEPAEYTLNLVERIFSLRLSVHILVLNF